ncbi:hypothetical protein SPRG_03755 [Saprolegnia parasitica CBS 223.65]|uniref:Uncharacterized protein n=1 Tax=Saprolegnia parasitica (strain CBS 223.65) TaxID=695850 RepID=A0A067CRG5_SAPPC|nr:hypothetical protein SPRG_03755 [Saprolegnia parasitica CBS 223.65]KDO31835.1 hypothetical protein SPRG_03755 [Saprolegnia parasitica CBS 223.65]|eukprot:XP_012197714.1 hypothetical protein SPRG_03755 [Saprolegnia parasitica CBS 223.65]
MPRDVLEELVFLEFLCDWRRLETVVTKADLVDLLNVYEASVRCSPQFETWWRLLRDKSDGSSLVASRLKVRGILQGDGDARNPYMWHRRALEKETQMQSTRSHTKDVTKTLQVRLVYADAFQFDVRKWTQVAIHVLRTQPTWMTTNLFGQAKTMVSQNVEPKAYATAIVEAMKLDPRMVYSLDKKSRGVFARANGAYEASMALSLDAAVVKFTAMAQATLQHVSWFPVATILAEARRRRGFPCLRYKAKKAVESPEEAADDAFAQSVAEAMRRNPSLAFVQGQVQGHEWSDGYFTLPHEAPRAPAASLRVAVNADKALRRMTRIILTDLELHASFPLQRIRVEACPPGWSADGIYAYLVKRLCLDDRLHLNGDHFVRAVKLDVASAASYLLADVLEKLATQPTVSYAYIAAKAAKLQPEGLVTLDEYVGGIIDRLRADDRVLYGADALGRGNFGLANNPRLQLLPFTDGDAAFLAKAEAPTPARHVPRAIVTRCIRIARDHWNDPLASDTIFGVREILAAAQLDPDAGDVDGLVRAMVETDTRLRFVPHSMSEVVLDGGFALAIQEKRKRSGRGDVHPHIDWYTPHAIALPDDISQERAEATPEVDVQEQRMWRPEAAYTPDDNVRSEPVQIPLRILRFE